MSKLSIIREFWEFLKARKGWWLVPIVVFLLLFGGLMILLQNPAISPFVYALF